MLFDWFSTKEIDSFAISLALEFAERCPAKFLHENSASAKKRIRTTTELLLHRTQKHAQQKKLNFFKRARLANTLKWKLRELGYDGETINALTIDVAKTATLAKPEQNKKA